MNENFDCCEERDAAKSLVQRKAAVRHHAMESVKDMVASAAKPQLRIFSQYDQSIAISTKARSIPFMNSDEFCSDQEAA